MLPGHDPKGCRWGWAWDDPDKCKRTNKRGAVVKNRQAVSQVSDLPIKLAAPARRALVQAGYTRLEQIAGASEGEIARLHGIGPNALEQIRGALAEIGLSFRGDS